MKIQTHLCKTALEALNQLYNLRLVKIVNSCVSIVCYVLNYLIHHTGELVVRCHCRLSNTPNCLSLIVPRQGSCQLKTLV